MKRIFSLVLTLSLTALSASTTLASPTGYGARAVGMGGAYTAIADDESAAYWNPAGITQTKHLRFAVGGGYHGDLQQLKDVVNKISDDQMPDREDMNDDYSITALVGLTAKHVGINVFSDSLLTTSEDPEHMVHATLTSTNYGIATLAGHFGKSKKLSVGVNLKAVVAGYGVAQRPDVQYFIDKNTTSGTGQSSYITATGTACDLGLLYQLNSKINLGFTARNLYNNLEMQDGKKTTYSYSYNSTTGNVSEQSGAETTYYHEITIPKSYVCGLAFKPFKHTVLAADLENITDSDNDQTRLHVGLEQNALWNLFSLRAGYFTYKDDSTKEDSTGYTAGLGVNLWILNCSAACVKTDDDKSYMATANIKF